MEWKEAALLDVEWLHRHFVRYFPIIRPYDPSISQSLFKNGDKSPTHVSWLGLQVFFPKTWTLRVARH